MTFEEVEKNSIEIYMSNKEFLKKNHPYLHKKLELFEMGINEGLVKEKYDLEYKEEGYFDALNLDTNTYYYNENSIEYGKKIVQKKLEFFPDKSSFRAFYDIKFSEDVAKTAENATMYSDAIISNAPVVHYVNSNVPKKQEMKTIPKLIILGVGLGTHIPFLHLKAKSKAYLIIEPNLEMFRLSLFTVKYYNLAESSLLFFSIAENDVEFKQTFTAFHGKGFIYNHYIKHFIFSTTCEVYIEHIQSALVTQNHITYDFSRLFQSLNKSVNYVKDDFTILDIKPKQIESFENKPILLLAAGPSLQKHLEFVKKNQDRFIIVAVYVLLPFLEKHNIKPDIVTQYDQATDVVYGYYERLVDKHYFDNTLFLVASHVDKRVSTAFPKENVFVYQAMYDVKYGFDAQTAPSIGEITYSLLLRLGAKEIFLLGLDMAFDSETDKTHVDDHNNATLYKFKRDQSNNFTLTTNVIKTKGNFKDEVETVSNFKISIQTFNQISIKFKKDDVFVYNLSDGAYFEKTIPLHLEELEYEKFLPLNKEEFRLKLNEQLSKYSEVGFSDLDKKLIELKLTDAEKIKALIEEFFKTKEGNLLIYESRLGKLVDSICFNDYKCIELRNILLNYIMNNVHYIYHLINMKALDNPKKHIKSVNKILQKQLLKIVNTYIDIFGDIVKEEKE